VIKAASDNWPFSVTRTILYVTFDLSVLALVALTIIYW
jgi:hypothetical protein